MEGNKRNAQKPEIIQASLQRTYFCLSHDPLCLLPWHPEKIYIPSIWVHRAACTSQLQHITNKAAGQVLLWCTEPESCSDKWASSYRSLSWVSLAGSVSSIVNRNGKWANLYRKMSYHNTGNSNINSLSKLCQFSAKYKTFAVGVWVFFPNESLFSSQETAFFSKNCKQLKPYFFLVHKLLAS